MSLDLKDLSVLYSNLKSIMFSMFFKYFKVLNISLLTKMSVLVEFEVFQNAVISVSA